MDRKFRHTPGPWTTDEADHDCPYQSIRIKGQWHHIAEVWFDDAPVEDYNREQAANARLIVAAPDLLNALVVLANAVESIGIPVDAAKAAIKKAMQP